MQEVEHAGWHIVVDRREANGSTTRTTYLAAIPDRLRMFREMWSRFQIQAPSMSACEKAPKSLFDQYAVEPGQVLELSVIEFGNPRE